MQNIYKICKAHNKDISLYTCVIITNEAKVFLLCALMYVNQITAHPSDTAPWPMSGTEQILNESQYTEELDRCWMLTNLTDISHILCTEGLLTRDKTIKAIKIYSMHICKTILSALKNALDILRYITVPCDFKVKISIYEY